MEQLNKGARKMTIRNPVEMLPTMKVNEKKLKDGDILASECEVVLLDVKDVETDSYGLKIVGIVENEQFGKFQIFLNNFSIEKLVEAFGDEDNNWKGKRISLKVEEDPQFKNEMIVTYPIN